MAKDTSALLEELKSCSDFTKFYNENSEVIKNISLSEHLNGLLIKKGLKKSDVVRASEMSEVYVYQIFSGLKTPKREKLLCLAFGMGLDFKETQEMLKIAGYPQLYPKKPFDCVIIYALCNGYSILQTNELLYDYSLDTIG